MPSSGSLQRPSARQTSQFEWHLLSDWAYVWERSNTTDRITIPAGVVWNPSVPGVFNSLVPRDRLWLPSLPHDIIYKLQGNVSQVLERKRGREWKPVRAVGRQYADKLFRHLLRQTDVSGWRTRLAYWAVRSPVGWLAWREEDPNPLP